MDNVRHAAFEFESPSKFFFRIFNYIGTPEEFMPIEIVHEQWPLLISF